ncbi:hypothetical protein MMC17_007044 [Xylographa soralifera]|nr:hypothetical protein [Xylographa soralifera]
MAALGNKNPNPETMAPTGQKEVAHPEIKSLFSSALYFSHTLYLLTLSNLDTFCIPQTLFGLFGAFTSPILTTNPTPSFISTLGNLPNTFLHVWLNTVVFDLGNQRLPESVKEDALNKPWRPLAAGRLTTSSATQLLLAAIPITFAASLYLGGVEETVLLFSVTYMYNELGGSDHSVIVHNALIATLYVLYSAGSMRVASAGGSSGADQAFTLNPLTYKWLAIIAAVIFTTIHVQCLKDVEGDRVRQRKMLASVVGSEAARWFIAASVCVWSVVTPAFWELKGYGYVVSGFLAAVVAGRVLRLKGKDTDRTT